MIFRQCRGYVTTSWETGFHSVMFQGYDAYFFFGTTFKLNQDLLPPIQLDRLMWIAGHEPFMGIARCWSKSIIKDWLTENHSRWWTATSGCNHSKELLGPRGNRSWREFIYSSDRREAKLLVQIITGYGNLRYHLHKMGFEMKGRCRWCGEESKTAFHLLTKCAAWLRTRTKWFGKYLPSQDLIKSASAGSILGFWKEAGMP